MLRAMRQAAAKATKWLTVRNFQSLSREASAKPRRHIALHVSLTFETENI